MSYSVTKATVRKELRNTRRCAALVLLLVLLGGLSITSFTRDWIGSLPSHDHLILGARAMGLLHHTHRGDQLTHWMNGVEMVGAAMPHKDTTGAGQRSDSGIISLKSLSGLQPEINSYTATGLFALVALIALAARGVRLRSEYAFLANGQFPAPLSPPPQPA